VPELAKFFGERLMSAKKPRGVDIIAGILGYPAVMGIFEGIIYWTLEAPSQYQQILRNIMFIFYFTSIGSVDPTTGIIMYGASITMMISYNMQYIQLSILNVGLLIFSASCILAIIGLYQMKKWGRYLALIIGLVYITIGLVVIVFVLLSFISTMGTTPLMVGSGPDLYTIVIGTTIVLLPIIIGVGIVWYLMGDVKYKFE
jgi:uncharacterized membrane protein (DUF2068 family)